MSDKPNVLIIWGDDIGQSNLSCYSNGLMGYRTPNIDRVAAEGVLFTDYYAEQSCTAGRAAFITGQNPYRTGLTKVGLPGAPLGLQAQDPTIATALKAQGYATGQFGKNHLGDRDEHLPTMHGFDEFFGNLYHLNAEEEPELPDYPKDPEFRKKLGPAACCTPGPTATAPSASRTPARSPKSGWKPATANSATPQLISSNDSTKPKRLVLRVVQHHAHAFPYPHPARERGPRGALAVALPRHDAGSRRHGRQHAGDLLDELGIAENTIVMYSTDNGPHMNSWPDAGMTPSATRRTPTGRAPTASRRWCAGRGTSRQARC